MRLAANALSCAQTSEMNGVDERYFGGGEAIGVEAVAAVMGAAPVGADHGKLVSRLLLGDEYVIDVGRALTLACSMRLEPQMSLSPHRFFCTTNQPQLRHHRLQRLAFRARS